MSQPIPSEIAKLLKTLKSAHETDRITAIRQLVSLKNSDDRILEALQITATTDSVGIVRYAAAEAYLSLAGEPLPQSSQPVRKVAKNSHVKISTSSRESVLGTLIGFIIILGCVLIYQWLNPSIPIEFKSQGAYYREVCSDATQSHLPNVHASKLIVVQDEKGEVENGENFGFRWHNIPNVARNPEEVRYLGCLHPVDVVFGYYGGAGNYNCPALQKRLELTVIDLKDGTTHTRLFEGDHPPDEVSNCKRGVMYPDADAIKKWLLSVTQ